jgi:hypothetical protein
MKLNCSLTASVALLVSVLVLGCNAAKSNSQKQTAENAEDQSLEKWQADPVLLEKLDEYVKVGPFEMRPPKGFAVTESELPGVPGKTAIWTKPLDSESTSPLVQIMYLDASIEEEPISAEEFHQSQMRSQTKPYERWEKISEEKGTFNGFEAIKTRWKGTRTRPFLADQSFNLDCCTISLIAGEYCVGIRTHVFDHNNEFPIELGIASMLTLKRREE